MKVDEERTFTPEVCNQEVEEAVNDECLGPRPSANVSPSGVQKGPQLRTSYMSRIASIKKAASREKSEMRDEQA